MDKAGRLGMAVHQAASFSPPLMGLTASRAVFWPGCALMSLDPAISGADSGGPAAGGEGHGPLRLLLRPAHPVPGAGTV